MSAESSPSNILGLESLRIARGAEPETHTRNRNWLASAGLVIGALTSLGAASYRAYSRTRGGPLEGETQTVTAQQGGQPGVILTGSGYVVTRHKYITIGTKILGQIVEEPIEEGQHVRKGQLLARIDDRDYQAQMRQAIADRDLAQANVRLTSGRLTREGDLYRQHVVSKEELDAAENAAAVAQATLRRSEAAVDYARFMVSQCRITSPLSGVVLQKYRELGDTINFGGTIQAGGGATDIAQLADTGEMRAEVDINESDVARVRLGTPAIVVPDAYPDHRFDASLVKIYPEADRQKGTVKVEVKIDRPDMRVIKPEMSVKVNFLSNGAVSPGEPRLLVPKTALITAGNASYVWALRGGVARRVSILRGREQERAVEVTRGLADGEVVIVNPPANLSDGQEAIVKTQKPPA